MTLYVYTLDAWYQVQSAIVYGSTYSNYTFRMNMPNMNQRRLRLDFWDVYIDDIEMRVAP